MSGRDGASQRITTGEVTGTIIVIALVIVFGRLCVWQLHRLHERRTTNAGIATRMSAAPVAGFAGITDTAGALYRRIEIHGVYDDAHSIILPGRSYSGTPGVHVLTPVILPDGKRAVLVNRGWVPSPDAATIDLSRVPSVGTNAITGLAVPFPDRRASISRSGDSVPAAGEFRRVWYTIDEKALRAQFPYPLAPFVLQLLPGVNVNGYPKPLPPPALDEGPHLSYAIQWFAFAMIAIIGWITFIIRRRAERGGAPVIIAPPHPPVR